jgi:hypothetical protein
MFHMNLLLGLALLGIAFAVSYGGYVFWSWVFAQKKEGNLKISAQLGALVFAAGVFALSGGSAFAQSDTIEFDLSPFFTSLNQYLPIFIGLFAVIGGIAGAMALARYVIGAVVRAFSGGTI